MNWLDELYRYTRHSKKESRECFVSAALSRLLSIDLEMQRWFYSRSSLESPPRICSVYHQMILKSIDSEDPGLVRPDIVMMDDENEQKPSQLLIIEIKIDADLGLEQLQRYFRIVQVEYPNASVDIILLSLHKANRSFLEACDDDESTFSNPTWDDFYSFCSPSQRSLTTKGSAISYLRSELCGLIEDWNMIAEPPIKANVLETVLVFDQLFSQMDGLLRSIVRHLDPNRIDAYSFRERTYWYAGAYYYDESGSDYSIYVFYDTYPEPHRDDLGLEGNLFAAIVDFQNNSKLSTLIEDGFYALPDWGTAGWAVRVRDIKVGNISFFDLEHIDLQAEAIANVIKPLFERL